MMPWNAIVIDPLLNAIVLLTQLLFGQVGLAIVALPVLVKLAMLPLTLRERRNARQVAALQPRIKEIERRHKDPRRRYEALHELYREAGVKPFAQIWNSLLQIPIWIAIYQALRMVLARTPERVQALAQRLYPWNYLQSAVPLPTSLLWLDLARPDPTFVLMGLVALTTWLSIRMSRSTADPTAAQARAMAVMQWMGPIMATGFALGAPSGLALYWVASNLATIVLNRTLDTFDRRVRRMPALPDATHSGR